MPDFKDVTHYLKTEWERKAVGFLRMHDDMAKHINEVQKACVYEELGPGPEDADDEIEIEECMQALKRAEEEFDLDELNDPEDIEQAVAMAAGAFIYGGYFASRWMYEQRSHEFMAFKVMPLRPLPEELKDDPIAVSMHKPRRIITARLERGSYGKQFGWYIQRPGTYDPLPPEYWARRTIEMARVDEGLCGPLVEWQKLRDEGRPPVPPEIENVKHKGRLAE